ncbi:Cyclin-dependent kinase 4 [Lamellibrachia satsuma]|nr:Cyclin-dependent kinase 4 [Lamellibrachia satsuma]
MTTMATTMINSRHEYGKGVYEEVALIGNGAYGTVYKARDLQNGRFVALKKIRIPSNAEELGMPMSAMREIASLKQLDNFEHPNIVRLLDVCPGNRTPHEMQLYLVFEHIDQDLAHYLEKCPAPGLGPDRIRNLMHQILNGVDFLHANRIVHRDLKPQNILVTCSGQVKLADFGLSRVYGFQMALTSGVVTLWYRAPEVLLQDQYCTAVDLWSCGCIFAELFTRKPLFCGQSDVDQLSKIFEVIGLPSQEEWPENISLPWLSFRPLPKQPFQQLIPELDPCAKDLLERMLAFRQSTRISAQDSKKHPYFLEEQPAGGSSSSSFVMFNPMGTSSPGSSDNFDDEESGSPVRNSFSD